MNRLAREASPYLLQHKDNPVDWFPWGGEAFAKAREEDRPVFLSIGYSTCHWCHVMERESFENPQVAEFLNRHFVSIKVDREERPDVDRIYMLAVQSLSGQGGWPLSAFLSPELFPFFGGTYFPPEDAGGRTGFLTVLRRIQQAWQEKRGGLAEYGKDLIRSLDRPEEGSAPLAPPILERAAERILGLHDPVHGGFGRAPKFPTPGLPAFLLRHGVRHGDGKCVEAAMLTCRRMAQGGIHDHVGGGFARYSVDERWLVPHFEKMLYDNAQLACLYLDCYRVSGQQFHAGVARGILDYVLRDMAHPEGGFYSAEDADSEGKEGKFYCWTLEEIEGLLPPGEAEALVAGYGITAEGNFVDHSDPEPLRGQNVLARSGGPLPSEKEELLESARARLFRARSRRVRPHLDDKILLSWNGMMLGAMARAGPVLGESRYLDAARRNFEFLWSNLRDPETGRWHHRWREGRRDEARILQSHACLLSGVLELHQATLEPRYLDASVEVADALIGEFQDRERGGFWQSADPGLILEIKEDHDGAEPSGNSVAALALLQLSAITGSKAHHQAAVRCLEHFSERLEQSPWSMPTMLLALDLYLDPPRRIVLHGERGGPVWTSLLRAAHSAYHPSKVILAPEEGSAGEAKADLCTAQACQESTDDPERVIRFLAR